MTTLWIPLDNETCLLESIWLGTAGKLLESEQSTWCLLQGQKPLCDPCALQWMDHNFFGTTQDNWKIAGLCSNISDGGEVKGFFIALLGDQALLCLCFVKLFSSGPRSREETDIINHMKPVYPLHEAVVLDFLGIDVQVNEQTFSICLISKCPWSSVYECCCMSSVGSHLEILWLVWVYSQSEWRFEQS